jgi:hypothetical protein
VQISFHEDRDASQHSMPPGGFRLVIVNATSLAAGQQAREHLRPVLTPDMAVRAERLAERL